MEIITDLRGIGELVWWGLLLFTLLAVCTFVVIQSSWKTKDHRKIVQMFECAGIANVVSVCMFILIGTINITKNPYEIVFWLTTTSMFSIPNLVFRIHKKEEYQRAKKALNIQEHYKNILDFPQEDTT